MLNVLDGPFFQRDCGTNSYTGFTIFYRSSGFRVTPRNEIRPARCESSSKMWSFLGDTKGHLIEEITSPDILRVNSGAAMAQFYAQFHLIQLIT